MLKPIIVIVDDNGVQLRLHELALKDAPIELHTFISPLAALEFLAEHDVGLVMLDIVMQELDGITVLKRLRNTGRHTNTAVLFVTGKDYFEDRSSAAALGAVDYLVKPLRPETLRKIVNKYLLAS